MFLLTKLDRSLPVWLALAVSLGCAGALTADGVPVARAAATDRPNQAPAAISALTLTPRLELPADVTPEHLLIDVVRKMWAGEFGDQPEWRLSLLVRGLREQPRTARVTAFSSRCADGGGPWTRWGTRVRRGICAADARYWGPGSVVWIDAPIEEMLIVEDTGSAIRGPNRFDICFGDDAAACSRFGVQQVQYIPLHVATPRAAWGNKPGDWSPPAVPVRQVLQCGPGSGGTAIQVKPPAPDHVG